MTYYLLYILIANWVITPSGNGQLRPQVSLTVSEGHRGRDRDVRRHIVVLKVEEGMASRVQSVLNAALGL